MLWTTADIQVLDPWEALRKRPTMYRGPDDTQAPLRMLDQAAMSSRLGHKRGEVKRLRIDVYRKAEETQFDRIRILDDGCGWDVRPLLGRRRAERWLTELHAGHGPSIQLTVVNALSASFEFTTWSQGYAWRQRFERGAPMTPFTNIGGCELHGIEVSFSLDPALFTYTLPTDEDLDAFTSELQKEGLAVELNIR